VLPIAILMPYIAMIQATLADLKDMLRNLEAKIIPTAELRIAQREKLLINACINPLTAILGCRNGALLDEPWTLGIMADVCREGVSVFSALDATSPQQGNLTSTEISGLLLLLAFSC